MKRYVREHRAAMAAYDVFEAAQREGRYTEASAALIEALQLEGRAARGVPADLEPTRSVLFRSAASIALDAGRPSEARHLIAEGLRGDPPPEIKGELLDLLARESFVHDDLGATTSSVPRPGELVQRLAIRRLAGQREQPGALSMHSIARIYEAWMSYVDLVLREKLPEDEPGVVFEPVLAAVGSFAVQLRPSRPLSKQRLQAFFDVVRDAGAIDELDVDRSSAANAQRSVMFVRHLVDLLGILRDERCQLHVEARIVGESSGVELFIEPPAHRVYRQLQSLTEGSIDSIDIPQADDLERLFVLVEHVHEHGMLPLPEQLGVVGRQLAYYRRAAEILGYLRKGQPTPAAAYLHGARSADRLRHALLRFESSDVGSAWIAWSGASRLREVEPGSAEDFLTEHAVGLSDATVTRRARTLQAWHASFSAAFDRPAR